MELIKKFDYIGLFLFTGGLLLFLIGLNWEGSLYPWTSVHVVSTITIGAPTIVAFLCWETFAKVEEPLIPIRLFANLPWVALIFVLAIVVTVYYAFL